MALLADQSRELITFRDIEDVEIQKDLVTPDLQGPNMENFLTLHHLAVDPLRMLTGGHNFLRIVEVLLWCSVPNSAEEFSGIELRSSIHSLLVITVRPSICDVASGMNASDLEHMHLCSFGMFETWPRS